MHSYISFYYFFFGFPRVVTTVYTNFATNYLAFFITNIDE